MIQIFNAFSLSFRNLFNLKILWILVWPLLVASLFWLIVGVFFWTPSVEWIAEIISFTFMKDWHRCIHQFRKPEFNQCFCQPISTFHPCDDFLPSVTSLSEADFIPQSGLQWDIVGGQFTACCGPPCSDTQHVISL